jgi:hypothetical protein
MNPLGVLRASDIMVPVVPGTGTGQGETVPTEMAVQDLMALLIAQETPLAVTDGTDVVGTIAQADVLAALTTRRV